MKVWKRQSDMLLWMLVLLGMSLAIGCGTPPIEPDRGVPPTKRVTPHSPTDEPPKQATWKPALAAKALETSSQAWHQNGAARRSDNKTACLSCHTTFTYLLARPMLRQHTDAPTTALETQLYKDIVWRVQQGDNAKPWYDSNPDKIKQSHGSEVVLNFVALSLRDARSDKSETSAITLQALKQMWARQITSGTDAGTWEWLDFNLGPWEDQSARYWGAAMAAIGLGNLPDYLQLKEQYPKEIERLQQYLLAPYKAGKANLYDKLMLLWASVKMTDLLAPQQQLLLRKELERKQRRDGSWSLLDLGPWPRAPEGTRGDGYATGLIAYVFRGLEGNARKETTKAALLWLARHQSDDGGWTAPSVNRGTQTKFMRDAATAFAVMALTSPTPQ